MNLALPKKLHFSLKNFSGTGILQLSRRVSRIFLWILFLGAVGWLGYFWYTSIHDYEWNESQKTQYESEYAGETSFRAERFNNTAGVLEERARLHQTLPAVKRDIFVGISL